MRGTAMLLALVALAACSSEPGTGGVTAGEAKALDEAAEMLEAQRLPESAVSPQPQQNPASPATREGAPTVN